MKFITWKNIYFTRISIVEINLQMRGSDVIYFILLFVGGLTEIRMVVVPETGWSLK